MSYKTGFLLSAFALAVIGGGTALNGPHVLDTSIRNGSVSGARYAMNVLDAKPEPQAFEQYAMRGDINAVSVMLELGVTDAPQRKQTYRELAETYKGRMPLSHAIEVMNKIADNAGDVIEAQAMKDSALEALASGDDAEMIAFLLNDGADPNAPGIIGEPYTLTLAAANHTARGVEIMALLLQHGGDPELAEDFMKKWRYGDEAINSLRQKVAAANHNAPPPSPAPQI